MGPKLLRPHTKWVPKRWRPEYEIIVALSATGMSREAVCDRIFALSGTKYTPQHISNILNTPEGVRCQDSQVDHIRSQSKTSLAARLERLQNNAMKRIETLMEDDKYFEKSPFQVVDRALHVVKNQVAPPAAAQGVNVYNNTLVMTEDAAKQLISGMNKADEVKQIHGDVTAAA